MRTPGRCTNVEGCWISASDRDVWLPVGDDFTCPNCGEWLTAPPRRVLSFRGLRQAAVRGTVVLAGLAAAALAIVTLVPRNSSLQPRVVAILQAPVMLLSSDFLGLRTHPSVRPPAPGAPGYEEEAAAPPAAGPAAQPGLPRMAARTPAGARTAAFSKQPAQSQQGAVLLYSASTERPQPPAAAARPATAPPPRVRTAQEDFEAATFITMLSHSAVVPPPNAQRVLVMPISFGKAPGPEDATPPANPRWRYRGIMSLRRTTFLPGPGPDPLADLYDTPSLLH